MSAGEPGVAPPTPPRRRAWTRRFSLTRGDVGRALLSLASTAVGLEVASWAFPGFEVGGWSEAVGASIAIFVYGLVLRPLLVRLAVLMGWVGAGLLGIFGQALVILLAVIDPQEELGTNTLLGSLLAAWTIAAVSTVLVHIATAGTDDALTASLLRRARRRPASVPDPEVPGVLFVQVDGLPYPVLQWSVRAGTLPTLSGWIRSGDYSLAEWRPMLPATTPASQMGILHGTIEGIPAFRWVDREEGKVYVANRPADAAAIEARHSNGRGLLADDGVSVSNLFTGDAVTAYATMSAIGRTQETKETRAALAQFLVSPLGLARGIPRVVAEVVRERFQQRRAIRRDIRPRVHRGWGFTGERAALTGVLRDLNTAMVADAMLRGRKSIYVDYVDYDAVAHHVGMLRPEALAALEDLDAVLERLEQIAAVAPRPYHLVILSDHGQSQGEVFSERYGEDLATLVSRLAETAVVSVAENHEGLGSLNSVVAGSSSDDSVLGRTLGRTSARLAEKSYGTAVDAALEEHHAQDLPAGPGPSGPSDQEDERFLVFGSGNLGLVYVAGESRRLRAEELDARYPALIRGLRSHPGVGFVVVDTEAHGPVAFGAAGEHRVRDGVVVGEDPLLPFGPDAPRFVLRAASMPETPDLYVNSLLDDLGEVAAFEGLVGCHGGLGGWQDRAVLVWPKELPAPEGMVVGADALHHVLVGWLDHVGHRRGLG